MVYEIYDQLCRREMGTCGTSIFHLLYNQQSNMQYARARTREVGAILGETYGLGMHCIPYSYPLKGTYWYMALRDLIARLLR